MSFTPKPHALYSLHGAARHYGRQGCGLNPIPSMTMRAITVVRAAAQPEALRAFSVCEKKSIASFLYILYIDILVCRDTQNVIR